MAARRIVESVLEGRFSMLLISCALMFFISPLLPGDQSFADQVLGWVYMVVLISCVRAIARTRRFFIFMVVFTLVNLLTGSYELLNTNEPDAFAALVLIMRSVYFIIVFVSIMRYVLDSSAVTFDKICGAISAYMVMGLLWSFVYTLFYTVNEQSFNIPEALLSYDTVNSTWAMYFSFTTLTTLGYGDITPQTPAVQSYAIMQAACGQVFLAVIVARLVALQIVHSGERE